ncbi:hypothetical protein MMC26_006890 [Xylographa opegraphella]|nr:hypothetical protein [Xylographa opegraphella]
MASSNSLSSRLEELRSRNPQSPPGEITYSGYNTPNRYSGSFMPSHSQPVSNDARANLQRRFTADSGNVPTLTPIGQPSQVMDPVDMYATTLSKAQALEKKKIEYEKLREQRRRFQAELEKFDRQQALEEKELHRMATDLQGLNLSTGHQSEPTTPPEYRDHVFPSIYSRRNRYSSSSLVSPPGINNRPGRSGSQLTSPPTEPTQAQASEELDKLPSKSVPGSRRGSTDRISSYLPENNLSSQRSLAKTNRYSMPVTSSVARTRDFVSDYASAIGMGPINTTGFLFGDDDEKPSMQKESTTSPDVKTYLQMNTTDDKFPILIRNNHHPGLLSASSAALDLALSQSSGPEPQANGWPTFARHRPSQQSLPQNVFEAQQSGQQSLNSPTSSSQQSFDASSDSPTSIRQLNRRSMEASLASYAQKSVLNQNLTNGTTPMRPSLANLQSSFSTNDIPTLKNANGLASAIGPPKSTAQQQFHNHNASLGRIPPSAVNNRHSREIVTGDTRREEPTTNGFKQSQSDLQASAAPFGPSMPASMPTSMPVSVPSDPLGGPMSPSSINQYPGGAYYGGYGMQLMNMGMTPVQMGGHMGYASQLSLYQAQTQYSPYSQYGQQPRFQDSQARVIQQRRLQNVEDVARFTNTKIENYQGDIYALCKDQHGCRYLQKQLEGRNPDTIRLIFAETNQHVVELMTDPFGNYLCQKLLEYSNDDQRTVLINNAAPQMVKIALNQHGTRALQKMIEFISTPEQIQTIIHALKDRVVELIKDLNGNHVIQKCLNRLTPEDAQFIFDAVGTNCVVVGTHRHGCCVLQRCIDHASGYQKAQLISQITENAFSLVQDPFGNYVLQYIVDLAEPVFTNPLCYSFQSSIPALSKQKFSSNVIEKCLRGSEPQITTMMIEEMLNANELEKMLRDSFANYVVQTALDYADAETRTRLVEAIRPILPAIRQTPYGRRIQSKILGAEGQDQLSGVSTPHDISSPGQLPVGRQLSTVPGTFGAQGAGIQQYTNGLYTNTNQNVYGTNGMNSAAQYTPLTSPNPSTQGHRLSNGSSTYNHFSPVTSQNSVHQPVPLYGRVGQTNGFNYF